MSRAEEILASVGSLLEGHQMGGHMGKKYIHFNFGTSPAGAGDYAGSTPQTQHLEDLFRSKGYVQGKEYDWHGPHLLCIDYDYVDRDVTNMIGTLGGRQVQVDD